jgi:hypothetical protein
MAKKTVAELEAEVAELRDLVNRMAGRVPRTEDLDAEDRPDYIPHGSPEHAAFLGLREVDEGDEVAPKTEGPDGKHYTLSDKTAFGMAVRPEFLQAILEQRAGELTGPKVPDYAPPMWRPTEVPASGITI